MVEKVISNELMVVMVVIMVMVMLCCLVLSVMGNVWWNSV